MTAPLPTPHASPPLPAPAATEAANGTPAERLAWQHQPREAFRQWLCRQPGPGYAPHSVAQYVAMVGAVADWLRDTERGTLLSARAEDLSAFLAARGGRGGHGAAATTVRRYLARLDALFVDLAARGLRDGNPAASLLRQHARTGPERPLPPALTPAQSEVYIRHVLAQPQRHWVDLRDRALQAIFLATGLTVDEVQRLRLPALRLDERQPVVDVQAHGPVPRRQVPVPPWALPVLAAWRDRRASFDFGVQPGADTVFVTRRRSPVVSPEIDDPVPDGLSDSEIYQVVRDAVQACGDRHEQLGPQTLRNTYALRQMQAGASDAQLQRLLGLHTGFTLHALRRLQPTAQASTSPGLSPATAL